MIESEDKYFMCGRFELSSDGNALAQIFGLVDIPALEPRFNIAPMQGIFVVRQQDGKRIGEFMQWGLVPSWAKEPSKGSWFINARCETIAEKPAFREAFRRRRCLISANSFYEWKLLDYVEMIRFGYTGGKKCKQPVRVFDANGNIFAFAGLWEHWKDPNGTETAFNSCTIITTKANKCLRTIHKRMPVIVREDDYERWLNCGDEDITADDFKDIFSGPPVNDLKFHFVSTMMNSARFDSPECILEIEGKSGLFG